MKGSGRGLIEVVSQHLPGGAEGNHGTPQKMAAFHRRLEYEVRVLTTRPPGLFGT
jgi:hypothetical protein